MSDALSPQTRAIVKACVPALEQHGVDITKEMYHRLLADKHIRDLFNISHQKTGDQPKALAYAILAYAKHIDNPAVLKDMIERIAEKHVGLNILPEYYPYVGKALLGAIKHVLGDNATDEVMDAWAQAYKFLADLFIGREHQIYQEHEKAPGGWTGWRPFRVAQRHEETKDTASFILRPVDEKPVMKHLPGQYLSFKLNIPGAGSERRNYTISSAPSSEYYRITVKRQKDGVVSDWFHDSVKEGAIIEVSAPAGDFVLGHTDRPLFLIAAGSGITPMMSIMETLVTRDSHPPIHLAYMTHTPGDEIFAGAISEFASKSAIKADIFYTRTEPKSAKQENIHFHSGHISSDWVKQHDSQTAEYYICGPSEFMVSIIHGLQSQNIPLDRIRYEMFGSASDPELVTRAA